MPGSLFSSWLVGLREAEVHDLHLAVLRDEHVGRRHVAVDDVERLAVGAGELVRVREALAELARRCRRRPRPGSRARSSCMCSMIALRFGAVDVLHDDEVRVVADADVEDLHAVRVRELRREARLVEEHRDELLLLADRCGRTRLMATCFRKPSRPALSARNTSAMPPDARRLRTRYRCCSDIPLDSAIKPAPCAPTSRSRSRPRSRS